MVPSCCSSLPSSWAELRTSITFVANFEAREAEGGGRGEGLAEQVTEGGTCRRGEEGMKEVGGERGWERKG